MRAQPDVIRSSRSFLCLSVPNEPRGQALYIGWFAARLSTIVFAILVLDKSCRQRHDMLAAQAGRPAQCHRPMAHRNPAGEEDGGAFGRAVS